MIYEARCERWRQAGPPVERLRGYLLQLAPAKRALLIAELERSLLSGDEVLGGDLLLQEVRSSVRESDARAAPRPGGAAVLPTAGTLPDRRAVRSPATSSNCSDLLAADLELDSEAGDRLSEAFTRALLDGGAATCDHLIRSFQDQAAARIRSMLDEIKTDDKARRRMIGQIGSPSALEEVRDLLTILAGRG